MQTQAQLQQQRSPGWETVGTRRDSGSRRPDTGSPTNDGSARGSRGGRSRSSGAPAPVATTPGGRGSRGARGRGAEGAGASFTAGTYTDRELQAMQHSAHQYLQMRAAAGDCRVDDVDAAASAALSELALIPRLQALENYCASEKGSVKNRPAFLTSIVRSQDRHWTNSRAAAELPGGVRELVSLPAPVLMHVSSRVLSGNCVPSDYTPEVVAALLQLTPPLAVQAIDAFDGNKRICAGSTGGVQNRPRFFLRLVRNVAVQNPDADDGHSSSGSNGNGAAGAGGGVVLPPADSPAVSLGTSEEDKTRAAASRGSSHATLFQSSGSSRSSDAGSSDGPAAQPASSPWHAQPAAQPPVSAPAGALPPPPPAASADAVPGWMLPLPATHGGGLDDAAPWEFNGFAAQPPSPHGHQHPPQHQPQQQQQQQQRLPNAQHQQHGWHDGDAETLRAELLAARKELASERAMRHEAQQELADLRSQHDRLLGGMRGLMDNCGSPTASSGYEGFGAQPQAEPFPSTPPARRSQSMLTPSP